MASSQNGHLEVTKELIKKGANIHQKDTFNKTALIYASESLRISKKSFKKDSLIEIVYMIIKKEIEQYIQLFITLNKNIDFPQELKNIVRDRINLLYFLQTLPIEIFEEIIKNL